MDIQTYTHRHTGRPNTQTQNYRHTDTQTRRHTDTQTETQFQDTRHKSSLIMKGNKNQQDGNLKRTTCYHQHPQIRITSAIRFSPMYYYIIFDWMLRCTERRQVWFPVTSFSDGFVCVVIFFVKRTMLCDLKRCVSFMSASYLSIPKLCVQVLVSPAYVLRVLMYWRNFASETDTLRILSPHWSFPIIVGSRSDASYCRRGSLIWNVGAKQTRMR